MCSLDETNAVKSLPKGKYTLVGVDIDTTGKRLIDEIVQLAAYTPNSHFEQYIMPYMNLNPAATNRHQVRVITIGFYRMLKSLQTFKVIKSKSEVAALKDFLNWLELLKKNNPDSDGIVMVYHEERKFIPYMILESLKKYDLLERFQKTVKAFANGFNLAQKNVTATNESPIQYLSLKKLAKALSGAGDKNNNNTDNNNDQQQVSSTSSPKAETTGEASVSSPKAENKKQRRNRRRSNSESDIFDGSASIRAKMTYNVALRLTNNNNNSDGKASEAEIMHDIITQYAQPISCDLDELESQNMMLERQNSFRPVFLNYFKATLQHRLRAVKYRIILAENGHDLNSLNTIWTEKQKEGLAEVIQAIEDLKQEDKTDLIDLFDSFYDPTKTTIKPVVKNNRRSSRRSGRNRENQAGGDSNNISGDNKAQPDSTTKDGPVRRAPRSRRRPRSRKNSNANNSIANNSNAVNTTTSMSSADVDAITTFAAVIPEIAKVPLVSNL